MKRRPRRICLLLAFLAMIQWPGCRIHRNGEPFGNTRAELEVWKLGGLPGPLKVIDVVALPVALALDVTGLPVDLAIQAFGPARIRVVDEAGNPISGADAIFVIDYGSLLGSTVYYRQTGRNGTFRIRRRVSEENLLDGDPAVVLVAKDGFCPVREVDFSAFTTSNVMTVTMPRLAPGIGYIVERAPDDPASRFPPWPVAEDWDWWHKMAGIQCVRGTASPWDDRWNYTERPWDFKLEVEKHNQRFHIDLRAARRSTDDGGVAVAPIDPEHPNAVPEGTKFSSEESLPADALAGDNPRQAVFFRLTTASRENQYQYGRIDFYWENGLPVGIRRIHFFDPKEQHIIPAPAPSRYFE